MGPSGALNFAAIDAELRDGTHVCALGQFATDRRVPGTSATLASVTVTGTVEFRADGTEVSTGSISESVSYAFPQSCLKQACADTAQALSTSTMANGQTPSGASCSASGSTFHAEKQ